MYSQKISTEHMKKTFVIKRNGKPEEVSFDKINIRIKSLCDNLEIDPIIVAQKVISQIYDNIPTSELDELAGRACAALESKHPDYGELAKRIIISNNHKVTSPSFSETVYRLYHHDKNDKHSPIVSKELYDVVMENKEKLNAVIDYQRDYNFDYFSFKTLEKSYLKKINGKVIERIQHLIMRVSLGLHLNDLKSALRSYEYMSLKYFIQATPTLFHSGTPKMQLASCFLMGTEDSIDGIYKTISDCAKISKWAGGIGLHISNVRSRGTYISGTDGKSDGIVPMLKVYNGTAKYVNQCFTPDTIVFTKEDGVVRMDKVKEGNEMVTKDGTYKKINKVFIRELAQPEELICYQSKGSPEPVKCTKQHEIYCLNKNNFNIGDTFVNLKAGSIHGVFKPASELIVGDFIGFPIPQYTLDYLEESPNFYYLYGVLLNYGRIETSYDYKLTPLTKYYVSLDPSYDDHQIKLKTIKAILDTANIKYKNYLEENKVVIYWKRFTYETDIKYDMLYKSAGIKHICPNLMHLPVEKLKRMLSGILDNTFQIKTTSPQLVHGIRYLFLRMGVLVGGQSLMALENDKIYRDFNQATDRIYTLEVPSDQVLEGILDDKKHKFEYTRRVDKLDYFTVDNIIYTCITSLSTIQYQGPVYDFNMNRNHNYLIHGGLVHNSGKRPGAFAIYLEPHHPDIEDFLELPLNHGPEDRRARDLFYAIWASDLFMERVEEDKNWSLFDPDECPGLNKVYGDEYKQLYHKYESEGKAKKVVKARDIMDKICVAQIEVGHPYMLFKDHINRKSNQKNYGPILSSNLCAEIVLYTDSNEYAVCVLGSLSLPAFIKNGTIDHEKLADVASVAIRNLDRIVDINWYPTPETERSNKLHRPLGLGVQGLADLFALLELPFDSPEAKELNKQIFETIYYGAVRESIQLAKEYGTYPTYKGSPMSKGEFQFDMWGVTPSARWDWNALREEVLVHGVRNSTLIALMPTASTSQILGNNECFEAYTSNLYLRRTMAGDFVVVNTRLVRKLLKIGLWNEDIKNMIVANNGSIQNIEGIPQKLKNIFKTVWEIKQKDIVEMSADRAPYVCQTQSLNIHMEEPTNNLLIKSMFYAWKRGLKTASYYVRSRPKVQTQQFSIDPSLKQTPVAEQINEPSEALICSLKNPGACDMCSG
jgi:ribonucleoside-diphosphate reductase alpha subunit